MKNKQAIYLLFLANIISGIAQGISMIAIPWYFVEIIDMPRLFSISYILITFSTLFWGLYAGTLIDRYSRKKIFIFTDIACGLSIFFVALSGFYFGSVSEYLVIFVFALTIFNYNIHYPNLYAFGQEITERKFYGKLNSYIEIQGQSTSVLAGAFAAILLTGTVDSSISFAGLNFQLPFEIEKWSIQEIFLVDSITYFLAVFIILLIKYIPIKKADIQKGNIFKRFSTGLKFLKKNKVIFKFGFASYMLFAFTLVQIHVLLPSYVKNFLNKDGHIYASAEIYYSIGAILAGVFIIKIFRRYNTVFGVLCLIIFVMFGFLGMSIFDSLVVFFIANLILGVCNAGVRVLRTTYIFKHVPNNIIGRINSVFNSLNILVRMVLIAVFSLPFFSISNNIRWAYLTGVIF